MEQVASIKDLAGLSMNGFYRPALVWPVHYVVQIIKFLMSMRGFSSSS